MSHLAQWDKKLSGWPEPILNAALIAAAGSILLVALLPNRGLLKATVLAWVLLP